MDNLQIESKWRTELKGSPIVQLSNGKWQTWIQIKDKLTDRGRKRFTNTNRDTLISGLERVINKIQTGKIVLADNEMNITAPLGTHRLLLELEWELQNEKLAGKKRALSERINRNNNLIKIFESCDALNNTPLHKWGFVECQMFLDSIKNVSRKQTANTNNKYFTQLKLLFSYVKVKFGVPLEHNIVEKFQSEPHIRKTNCFSSTRKKRKYNLKKLMSSWNVDMMRDFFKNHIPYEKNPIWHMALYVLANTGMRCGELWALTISDFKYSHNGQSTLTVSGFVDRDGVRTTYGKNENAELRLIPIGRGLAEKLKEYIPTISSSPLIDNQDKILFPQLAGHKNNTGSATRNGEATFYKACTTKLILKDIMTGEYALPKGLRFHFFRSWIATQWYSNEIYNDYEMTNFLGHSDIRTTQESYIHVVKGIHKKVDKQDFKDNLLF